MKKIAIVATVFSFLFVNLAIADTFVNGYTRQDGTYVAPHYRSSPNSTTLDNYSTKGNVNPYTGKAGTVDPYPDNSYKPYKPYKPYSYGN